MFRKENDPFFLFVVLVWIAAPSIRYEAAVLKWCDTAPRFREFKISSCLCCQDFLLKELISLIVCLEFICVYKYMLLLLYLQN